MVVMVGSWFMCDKDLSKSIKVFIQQEPLIPPGESYDMNGLERATFAYGWECAVKALKKALRGVNNGQQDECTKGN